MRLVPAGIAALSLPEQQALCECSQALVAHMLSRGAYCGAAGKLVAAVSGAGQGQSLGGTERASTATEAAQAAAGPATLTLAAGGEAPAAPPSTAELQPSRAALPAAGQAAEQARGVTVVGPASVDGAEAGGQATEEDAEVAEAAAQLVSKALHRVLLLHDGRGLPRSVRQRRGDPADGGVSASLAAADEAGFLLVALSALDGTAATGTADDGSINGKGGAEAEGSTAIDWQAARRIAAAAAFEGSLLDWLRLPGSNAGDGGSGGGDQHGMTVDDGGGSNGGSAAPALGPTAVRRALSGRVLITTYNGAAYLYRQEIAGLSSRQFLRGCGVGAC